MHWVGYWIHEVTSVHSDWIDMRAFHGFHHWVLETKGFSHN